MTTPKHGQRLLNMDNLVEHNGLFWEIKTERDTNGNKVWKRYDVVVEELAAKGLRLPSLQEQGKLLVAGLEGKLTGAIKDVAEDLGGEWVHGGYGHEGGKFVSCPDATFAWDYGKYVVTGQGRKELIPAKKINGGWYSISSLGDAISKYVYGIEVNALPRQFKMNSGFYFWEEGVLWPVTRGDITVRFNVSNVSWASRGVQRKT